MLKILIADPSYLVKKGLIDILNQFQEVTQIKVIGTQHGLTELINSFNPNILLINSDFKTCIGISPTITITIYHSEKSENNKNSISILDSKVDIIEVLTPFVKAFTKEKEVETESEDLTPREKLILKNVTLGLTNKEIANKLHISTHTVISHRKNITRKLNIKSVSGLTVYAILNDIIKMEDVS